MTVKTVNLGRARDVLGQPPTPPHLARADRLRSFGEPARSDAIRECFERLVAPLLDHLPILATRLNTAPQGELRALFDALQLDIVFQPADGAVDVAVTLYDGGGDTGDVAAQVRAEDWLVPPAVSWFRTSEWGVSRHRHSVSQVFGMGLNPQAAACPSVALSSPLCSPASPSPR